MPTSWASLLDSFPFSRIFRQLEQEMETVVRVLQPGPLGIIEHKFSADEIREANAAVVKAVEKWRRHANIEQNGCVSACSSTKLYWWELLNQSTLITQEEHTTQTGGACNQESYKL